MSEIRALKVSEVDFAVDVIRSGGTPKSELLASLRRPWGAWRLSGHLRNHSIGTPLGA